MKLIADTHVLLWWLTSDPRLGPRSRATLADRNVDVRFSCASPWELAIKVSNGKLRLDLLEALSAFESAAFRQIDIMPPHVQAVAAMERHHGDPFDRLIAAQAIVEGATVMTADRILLRYPIRTMGCD